ncbi:hypothetical protein KDK_55220 [Dictyobacter kobayashii]|uniref:Uncharacterized protein n=1 Tax=Dictyobacter kobayashii TaxID=2014872 RepID=A0A402ARK4_9CHLR|nr:hypothetical protein KDK_55220 [Dictyobacter kobayashii]
MLAHDMEHMKGHLVIPSLHNRSCYLQKDVLNYKGSDFGAPWDRSTRVRACADAPEQYLWVICGIVRCTIPQITHKY